MDLNEFKSNSNKMATAISYIAMGKKSGAIK